MNYLHHNVLLTLFGLLFLLHSCIKIIKHHSQTKRTHFPPHISHKGEANTHRRGNDTELGLGIYIACELFILAVNSGEGWDRDVSGGRDLNGEQGNPGGKLMKASED